MPDSTTSRSASLKLRECVAFVRETARREPDEFRRYLRLGSERRLRLCDLIQPWQLRDLRLLDPTWKWLARLEGHANSATGRQRVFHRSYIERPRGHSKTTDMAVQIAWILQYAPRRVTGIAAAADQDQAQLILQSLRGLAGDNRWLLGDLVFTQREARNLKTGSRLTSITSDVRSSFGALADFIVCDELCHWRDAGLWNSLLSTAAKKPSCLLTVLTNAGIGRGWQWEVREHARLSGDWHFSSLAGPRAPWISDAWLDEQRVLLTGPVFRRLWLNEWQHSDGEFVSLAEAEACVDDSLAYQSHGRTGVSYVAAIDYAEKHDYTVGCVCHLDRGIVVVDRMDVVRPTPTRRTPVEWVENWLREVGQNFSGVQFIIDEYQLVSVIQQWRGRYPIERFRFRGVQGNHDLAMALQQHILWKKVRWYRGCGAVGDESGQAASDTLEAELASLLLRQSVSGHMRIDHLRDGRHHDDRSFALGVCCLELAKWEEAFCHVTPPGPDGAFALA